MRPTLATLALVAPLAAVGCNGQTAVEVVARFDAGATPTQLSFLLTLNDGGPYDPVVRPPLDDGGPLASGASLLVLLPDAPGGSHLTAEVDALAQGKAFLSGQSSVGLVGGSTVTLRVDLVPPGGDPPGDGGDAGPLPNPDAGGGTLDGGGGTTDAGGGNPDAGQDGGTPPPVDAGDDAGGPVQCAGPMSCGGCCDMQNVCQPGTETNACGMGGTPCMNCEMGPFRHHCNPGHHMCM